MKHESGLLSVKEVEVLFRKLTLIESKRHMYRIRTTPKYDFPLSQSHPGGHPTYVEVDVVAWFRRFRH